jgi:hypothetical protein
VGIDLTFFYFRFNVPSWPVVAPSRVHLDKAMQTVADKPMEMVADKPMEMVADKPMGNGEMAGEDETAAADVDETDVATANVGVGSLTNETL